MAILYMYIFEDG